MSGIGLKSFAQADFRMARRCQNQCRQSNTVAPGFFSPVDQPGVTGNAVRQWSRLEDAVNKFRLNPRQVGAKTKVRDERVSVQVPVLRSDRRGVRTYRMTVARTEP